jgi:hypothetical protein
MGLHHLRQERFVDVHGHPDRMHAFILFVCIARGNQPRPRKGRPLCTSMMPA